MQFVLTHANYFGPPKVGAFEAIEIGGSFVQRLLECVCLLHHADPLIDVEVGRFAGRESQQAVFRILIPLFADQPPAE